MPTNLPTFLLVGAQKSGSTWLDAVLRTHPDVFMPEYRKGLSYFDDNYDKGIEWYGRFFDAASSECLHRGESTPKYLFDERAPSRIVATLGPVPVIAILRHPADRAASHYRHAQATVGFDGSFMEFVETDPTAFRRGLYDEQLSRYRALWPPASMLTLIFEDVIRDTAAAKLQLAEFLGVDPVGFGDDPANTARQTRVTRPRAMRVVRRGAGFLRQRGFDRLVTAVGKSGAESLLGSGEFLSPDEDAMSKLTERYMPSIEQLEQSLGRDLDVWRDE